MRLKIERPKLQQAQEGVRTVGSLLYKRGRLIWLEITLTNVPKGSTTQFPSSCVTLFSKYRRKDELLNSIEPTSLTVKLVEQWTF
jgi:hypothetical protein